MQTTLEILTHPALYMLGFFTMATMGLKIYCVTRTTDKSEEVKEVYSPEVLMN